MKNTPILVLALLCATASAQERPRAQPITAEESGARQSEIDRQRTATQGELAQAEADCYRRFAVNDCLIDARAQFRPRLSALRKQEVAVRDGDRARKEEERQARLEEQRQTAVRAEDSARQRAAGNAAADNRNAEAVQRQQEREAAAPGNAARSDAQRVQAERRRSEDAAQRAQREADAPAARQRQETRQREAEERNAAQRRRETERNGKPLAAPLPANP